jgi:hypothetical protein
VGAAPAGPVADGHARKQALLPFALAGEVRERWLRPPSPAAQSGFPAWSVASRSARIIGSPSRAASLLDDLADLGLGHQPLTGAPTDSDLPCSLVPGEAEPDQLGNFHFRRSGVIKNDGAPSRRQPPAM